MNPKESLVVLINYACKQCTCNHTTEPSCTIYPGQAYLNAATRDTSVNKRCNKPKTKSSREVKSSMLHDHQLQLRYSCFDTYGHPCKCAKAMQAREYSHAGVMGTRRYVAVGVLGCEGMPHAGLKCPGQMRDWLGLQGSASPAH